MNIFETIGMGWVIFASVLASIEVLYLAFVGLRYAVRKYAETDLPMEIKEMFKIGRLGEP